ncbi:hypothetical protein HDC92_004762 [Pedobacter sp. AK017]|nr:hypothetical protein [Pedobacter sp. AK017]
MKLHEAQVGTKFQFIGQHKQTYQVIQNYRLGVQYINIKGKTLKDSGYNGANYYKEIINVL